MRVAQDQLSDKLSRDATHACYTHGIKLCGFVGKPTSTYINKLLVQIFISALDNIHEQTSQHATINFVTET